MKHLKKIIYKAVVTLLLISVILLCGTSVSPIFDFPDPEPFSGKDIFNPYRNLDTDLTWKRANFHTHTRISGPLNECPAWPAEVLDSLAAYDYDIITFSNHNQLTDDPREIACQYNVYEHGYNLLKYHKLVFGCKKVMLFDHLLPLLPSQRQWQLDLLGTDADFIQLNHPARTPFSGKGMMESLSGYDFTELDSGVTTEQEYWDWALSAGHYSFGLANDDLHHPDRSDCIAVRCNWLNCDGTPTQAVKACLETGCFYSMRVPDFGNGEWKTKHEMNRSLPSIEWIGMQGDSTVGIALDRPAESISFIGQGHSVLSQDKGSATACYTMKSTDSYVRICCTFEDGCVIWSNPFARYDKTKAADPFRNPSHTVNWPLTLLYNIMLLAVIALAIFVAFISIRGISRR